MSGVIPFSKEDRQVARLAKTMALACGLKHDMARLISKAAALHDVGKVRVPKYILFKPGRLSPDEFEIVKNHTIWGADILSNLHGEFRAVAMNISELHHEKWDGTGYWGRKGGEIPLYCQIVTACDIYVALITKRSYKEPWLPCDALDYIKSESGKTFSLDLAGVFDSVFMQAA